MERPKEMKPARFWRSAKPVVEGETEKIAEDSLAQLRCVFLALQHLAFDDLVFEHRADLFGLDPHIGRNAFQFLPDIRIRRAPFFGARR
jgi:hypothetical protein